MSRTTVQMITIRQQSAPGERFAPGFLDSQIGKRVPLRAAAMVAGSTTVVSYEVVDDGRAVLITLNIELVDVWKPRHPELIYLDSGLEAGL